MSKLDRHDGTFLTLGTIGALAVMGLVRGGRGSKAKKKLYHFTVTGKGGFPRDMLRYDSCAVVKQDEAIAFPPPVIGKRPKAWHMETLPSTFLPMRSVRCVGPRPPTKQRWKGFGWTVEKESRGSKAKTAWASKWVILAKLREHLGDVEYGSPRALRKVGKGWLVEYRDLSGKTHRVIVEGTESRNGSVSLWVKPVDGRQT